MSLTTKETEPKKIVQLLGLQLLILKHSDQLHWKAGQQTPSEKALIPQLDPSRYNPTRLFRNRSKTSIYLNSEN